MLGTCLSQSLTLLSPSMLILGEDCFAQTHTNELPVQKLAATCYCDYFWILTKNFKELTVRLAKSKSLLLKEYLTEGRRMRLEGCFLNRVFEKKLKIKI